MINKKGTKVSIIIIGGLLFILLFVFLLSYMNGVSDFTSWNEVKSSNKELKIMSFDYLLYFEDVLDESEKQEAINKYTYYCKNKNCKGYLVTDEVPYAVIKDGKYYVIFNYENNTYRYLNIKDEINNVDVLYFDKDIYGLVVSNNEDNYSLYSFKNNSFITDYKYSNYENSSAALADNKFVGIRDVNDNIASYAIVDLDSGNEINTFVGLYENYTYFYSKGTKDVVYYMLPRDNNDKIAYDFYDSNFNLISSFNYGFLEVMDNGNALVKAGRNELRTYDKNGTLVNKNTNYLDILTLCEDYIIIVDYDNYMKIVDYNGNPVINIAEYKDSYYVNTDLSGWGIKDGKEVVYLVLEDNSVLDGVEGHGYEYYYDPSTKTIQGIDMDVVGGYEKPVIYLYPENDNTKVSIRFKNSELLTTSYPKYNNSWNVRANKNGDLYDLNNKYYYGLYFEEIGTKNISFDEGFYVTKNNAIEFLEEKLSIIGLNDKERNEFIMYWLPVLEKNEKSLVYFELTDSREDYNKLIIEPKVDSLLRVSIHIKKVNKKIDIKKQELPTFNRVGFTVVEWGGVNHK